MQPQHLYFSFTYKQVSRKDHPSLYKNTEIISLIYSISIDSIEKENKSWIKEQKDIRLHFAKYSNAWMGQTVRHRLNQFS